MNPLRFIYAMIGEDCCLCMADTPSATALDERYEILAEISKGGMGVVYKAVDRLQDKLVAVKILRPGQNVPGARRRFINEAQLLSRLKHPHIVVVHDFGTLNDGRNFLTMEYLGGPTLGSLLKTQPGRMDPLRACRIAVQISRALTAVHEQGVIHRDLKPENIFLIDHEGQRDFVKLIDFGIAKDTISKEDREAGAAEGAKSNDRLSGLADESYSSETAKTRPGTALGSPRYMAPEQIRGGDIDARTDQYALGCILYYLLVGALPFDGTVPLDVMMGHVTKPVPPPRQRAPELHISDALEAIVMRMLAKDRTQRFPTMREVEAALLPEIAVLEKRAGKAGRSTAKKPQQGAQGGLPIWPFLVVASLLLFVGLFLIRTRILGVDIKPNPAEVAAREAQKKESRELAEASLRWAREALGNSSASVREAGVAVLADCPQKEALPLLTGMLDDGDPTVRVAVARALARRPSPEPQALSALRLALRDTDARVLVAARAALLSFGDKEQRAQLRVLSAHTDVEVRRLLADSTAVDAGLLDVAEKLFGDPEPQVALAAARSLLVLKPGDARASARLLEATDLKEKIPAAPYLPIASGLPILRQAASDPDPQLRRLAAEAAALWPSAASPSPAIDLLRTLGDDKDAMVGARAKSLLARLLSRSQPPNRK
jgi:predicted Ser/Thr protein kinase